VTVAVLPCGAEAKPISPSDIEFRMTKGSGPGGQHKNKTESVVVATHKPTGVSVKIGSERSQHQNKAIAIEVLAGRVWANETNDLSRVLNGMRRAQIGSGMRGDKVRTIRTQDGRVICEITRKTKPFKTYERGDIWF